jgi:hypothetical protein
VFYSREGRIAPYPGGWATDNRAHEQLVEITYYRDNEHLFSVIAYSFLDHPFPENKDNPDFFERNVFEIDDAYAIIFVNNTHYIGSFDFDSWDYVEWTYKC